MAVKYIGDLDNDVMRGRGGGANITISTPVQPLPPPPAQSQEGNLWYDSQTGRMFMFAWGVWFQLF
jgi:hypothetical protein